MASFIAGDNYTTKYYPSSFILTFPDKNVAVNRLGNESRLLAYESKRHDKLEKYISKKRVRVSKLSDAEIKHLKSNTAENLRVDQHTQSYKKIDIRNNNGTSRTKTAIKKS